MCSNKRSKNFFMHAGLNSTLCFQGYVCLWVSCLCERASCVAMMCCSNGPNCLGH